MSLQCSLRRDACERTQQRVSPQLTHTEQEASVSPSPVTQSPPTAATPKLWHPLTAPTLIHVITHSELPGCLWLESAVHKEVGWNCKWFTMQIWHSHNSGWAPLWKQRRRHVKNWCGLFYQAERQKRGMDQERGNWRRKSVWVSILKRDGDSEMLGALTCMYAFSL